MKHGYREVRRIDSAALRGLCVRENWFTNGNNEEYAKLFEMARKDNLTTYDIVEIARYIAEHSDVEMDELTNVMFKVAERCFTFFEEAPF